ncbi:hypothetical protein OG809_05545 [Kribbella soli]
MGTTTPTVGRRGTGCSTDAAADAAAAAAADDPATDDPAAVARRGPSPQPMARMLRLTLTLTLTPMPMPMPPPTPTPTPMARSIRRAGSRPGGRRNCAGLVGSDGCAERGLRLRSTAR